MNIIIQPAYVLRLLLGCIGLLLLAHLAALAFRFGLGNDHVKGFVPLFNLDREMNFPSLYSAFAIFLAALWLLLIAREHHRRGEGFKAWAGLSLIFAFLAFDEALSFHEHLIDPIRETLGTSGILFFAWVIPYAILCLLFLAAYLRFLLQLPPRSRNLFVISGSIYVFGAMGMELPGAYFAEQSGIETLTYALITTMEETLEMIGMALFNFALVEYAATRWSGVRLSIDMAA